MQLERIVVLRYKVGAVILWENMHNKTRRRKDMSLTFAIYCNYTVQVAKQRL